MLAAHAPGPCNEVSCVNWKTLAACPRNKGGKQRSWRPAPIIEGNERTQDRVIRRVLGSRRRLTLPWPLRLVRRFPVLAGIPARLIGLGVRPEHVRTPDVFG